MGRIPALTPDDVIRALHKLGFEVVRQRGSHVRMRHPDLRIVTVPVHAGQDLGRGILGKILRDAQLTRQEFLGALRN